MNENKTVGTASEAPTVPGVDVKIFSPKNPEKDHGKLLAFASVNLGGVFAVNNIRIYATEKGPFVAMPSTKGQDGKYHDVCCPTTKEMRKTLNTAILDAYQREVERPSVRGALKEAAKDVAARPEPTPERKADKGAR